MATFYGDETTEIMSADAQGNVWEEPLVFTGGTVEVPDDQQDVIAALQSAVGNGAITTDETPSEPAPEGAPEEPAIEDEEA